MKRSTKIANRFREVFLNGTWIANTNYKKVLEDISWEQAVKKTDSLNTIALLTFHINYYVAGVLQVFEVGKLEIKDKFSFNAPEITSKDDWKALRESLLKNAEELANFIEKLSEDQLKDVFVDKKYGSYEKNINGIIEHAYYHLGQISLIKKIIE